MLNNRPQTMMTYCNWPQINYAELLVMLVTDKLYRTIGQRQVKQNYLPQTNFADLPAAEK